jgi:pyruvoyl-dependent arginine decarboxylase (PvlArgDC)
MSWRNHGSHKEETKAVKKALADAGIEASVTHGTGTAWGWLHVNLGDPRKRDGLIKEEFGFRYTEEENELHKKVLKIVQDVTGRHGEYDGEIIINAQSFE